MRAQRPAGYFGTTPRSPPALPGGGITGMVPTAGGRITGVCPAVDGGRTTPLGTGAVMPESGTGRAPSVVPGTVAPPLFGWVNVVSPPAPGGRVGAPGRTISGTAGVAGAVPGGVPVAPGPVPVPPPVPWACADAAASDKPAASAAHIHHGAGSGRRRRNAMATAREPRCFMPAPFPTPSKRFNPDMGPNAEPPPGPHTAHADV